MSAVYKLKGKLRISNVANVIKFPEKAEHENQDEAVQEEKYKNRKVYSPVQPLKTKEEIDSAKSYFLNRPERYKGLNIRDWCIFVLGINLARRAGDLLNLRVHNIMDENGNIRSKITIVEQKTGKTATLIITPVVRDALRLYLESANCTEPDSYLFPSRTKKCKNNPDGAPKAMTVVNFYKKLQQLKDELGFEKERRLGTHSMRKTLGYKILRDNKDDSNIVAKISKMYKHSNIETTFRYLGIEQEELDNLLMDNQL